MHCDIPRPFCLIIEDVRPVAPRPSTRATITAYRASPCVAPRSVRTLPSLSSPPRRVPRTVSRSASATTRRERKISDGTPSAARLVDVNLLQFNQTPPRHRKRAAHRTILRCVHALQIDTIPERVETRRRAHAFAETSSRRSRRQFPKLFGNVSNAFSPTSNVSKRTKHPISSGSARNAFPLRSTTRKFVIGVKLFGSVAVGCNRDAPSSPP